MDPDAVLRDARDASARLSHAIFPEDLRDAALVLMDAFDALDEWLGKGGFLPKAWAR